MTEVTNRPKRGEVSTEAAVGEHHVFIVGDAEFGSNREIVESLVPLEGDPEIALKTSAGFLRVYLEHDELVIHSAGHRSARNFAGVVVRPGKDDVRIAVDPDAGEWPSAMSEKVETLRAAIDGSELEQARAALGYARSALAGD